MSYCVCKGVGPIYTELIMAFGIWFCVVYVRFKSDAAALIAITIIIIIIIIIQVNNNNNKKVIFKYYKKNYIFISF